jgi:hypothetical protein
MGEDEGGAHETARFNCKCCGYRTLRRRYGHYDICEVCFWEADLDEDPYELSGPNRLSLNEGRLTFLTHGAMRSEIAVHARLPRPDDLPVRGGPKSPISPVRLAADIVAQRRERRRKRAWQEEQGWSYRLFDDRTCLEEEYGNVYAEWLAVAEYHDPLGIATSRYGLTYDAQIRWMLPFVHGLGRVDTLRDTVHAEFLRWFRPEIVGMADRYENLAVDLWEAVRRTSPARQ